MGRYEMTHLLLLVSASAHALDVGAVLTKKIIWTLVKTVRKTLFRTTTAGKRWGSTLHPARISGDS